MSVSLFILNRTIIFKIVKLSLFHETAHHIFILQNKPEQIGTVLVELVVTICENFQQKK